MIRQIHFDPSLSGSTYDYDSIFLGHQPDLSIAAMDYDSTRRLGGQTEVPWSQPNGHSFGSAKMGDTTRDFWNRRGAHSSNASSSHGRSSQDPSPPPLSSPSIPPERPTASNGFGQPHFALINNGGDFWGSSNGVGFLPRAHASHERTSTVSQRSQPHDDLTSYRHYMQDVSQPDAPFAAPPWRGEVTAFTHTNEQIGRLHRTRQQLERDNQERQHRLYTMGQNFSMPQPPLFAQPPRQEPLGPSLQFPDPQAGLTALEAIQRMNLVQQYHYQASIQQPQESQEPSDPVLREYLRLPPKESKKWELSRIYGHVVAFSGDTGGSRFIQFKLETATSEEKARVFQEIFPNAIQLMKDVFGNYVIQKIFEHGSQEQKRRLASAMDGKVVDLSTGSYSCRVVQKALECVLVEQQAELVKELSQHALRLMKDGNANHVIQKAIESVPREHLDFVMDTFRQHFSVLSKNRYGCRVVQRMLENCTKEDTDEIVPWIIADAENLALEDYGNYVLQHIIEHGGVENRAKVIQVVVQKAVAWSKMKRASNVVEKSIMFGNAECRSQILEQILRPSTDSTDTLSMLIKDSYGNYVIATLVKHLEAEAQQDLVQRVKPHLEEMTRQDSRRHRGCPNSLDKLRNAVDRAVASNGVGSNGNP